MCLDSPNPLTFKFTTKSNSSAFPLVKVTKAPPSSLFSSISADEFYRTIFGLTKTQNETLAQ